MGSLTQLVESGELRVTDVFTGLYDLERRVGLIRSRLPSTLRAYSDTCEILIGGDVIHIDVDYWRLGPRPGAMVWVINTTGGDPEIVILSSALPDSVEDIMMRIIAQRDPVGVKVNEAQEIDSFGLVIGIERVPLVIVASFSRSDFRSELLTQQSRLLWLLSPSHHLVPVLVKRWYSNQGMGTHQAADGAWRQLGTRWCLVCQELRW